MNEIGSSKIVIVPSTVLKQSKRDFPTFLFIQNTDLEFNGLPRPMVKPFVPSGILGLLEVSLDDASHRI